MQFKSQTSEQTRANRKVKNKDGSKTDAPKCVTLHPKEWVEDGQEFDSEFPEVKEKVKGNYKS